MAQDFVSEVIVAGRNLENATSAAAALGPKAAPSMVDAKDEDRLASQLKGCDILVNAATSWDDAMPALRAAIRVGTHYCDLDSAVQQAFDLDDAAKAARITAGMENGMIPGLGNLMFVHAASQLDEVLEVQLGWAWMRTRRLARAFASRDNWRETLAALRESIGPGYGLVEWWLRRVQYRRPADPSHRIRTYRDGGWVDIDPLASGVEVPRDNGGAAVAFPIFAGEGALVRPQYLPGVRMVGQHFSRFPPPLNELLCMQTNRIVAGEVDAMQAARDFYAAVERDPSRWLAGEDPCFRLPDVPAWWVRAIGFKAGAAARFTCWITPQSNVDDGEYVSVPGAVAALTILRGEARGHGVLPPEGCFEPGPFFDKVASLLSEKPPGGRLLGDRFEWLH